MLETKTQFETESRNTSIAQNIKPKHKHSPKTQAETSKIEKRGKDGSGQRPSVGCGNGFVVVGFVQIGDGSVEEERRDGKAVMREIRRKENEMHKE